MHSAQSLTVTSPMQCSRRTADILYCDAGVEVRDAHFDFDISGSMNELSLLTQCRSTMSVG